MGKKKDDKKKDEKKKKSQADKKKAEDKSGVNLNDLTEDCQFTGLFGLAYDEFKDAPQELLNHLLNPDTISHMIRGGLESYAVIRSMNEGKGFTEETRMHLHRTEREFLLAVKAVLDMRLSDLDKKIEDEEKRCGVNAKSDIEKGLKKIKVKD